MSHPAKLILSAGLGKFASQDANAAAHFGPDVAAKTKALLQSSISQAKEAGFEIVVVDVNPQDPEDTMRRFTETLRGREFVGVNVGYGLRGHKGEFPLVSLLC